MTQTHLGSTQPDNLVSCLCQVDRVMLKMTTPTHYSRDSVS